MYRPPERPFQAPVAQLRLRPVTTGPERSVVHSAVFSLRPGQDQVLWFRFPAEDAPRTTHRADPFVISCLLKVMQTGQPLHVTGVVSSGLLENLEEFQQAYAAFHPRTHRPVRITADRVEARPTSPRSGPGLVAFSGGVDGSFSLYRHSELSDLHPKRPIAGALLMHGFDVPIDEPATFAAVVENARHFLEDTGVALHTGATNLREFGSDWNGVFGTAVAAALSFFQPAYTFGLIASASPYRYTRLHHGSNPLTDPLLSSSDFQLVHDGAAFSRAEKIRHLTRWPAVRRHLRVCWQPGHASNCCRCEKCIRTVLLLRLCGVEQTEAFPLPIEVRDIAHIRTQGEPALRELHYLLEEARRANPRPTWLPALENAYRRNAQIHRLRELARTVARLLPPRLRTWATRLVRGRQAHPKASARVVPNRVEERPGVVPTPS